MQYGSRYDGIIQGICEESLEYDIGTKVVYCDRGFILLGRIIEIVTGQDIYDFSLKKYLETIRNE